MSTPNAGPHAWFAQGLAAYAAGLLPDDESRRIEAHLGQCEACRAALAAMREREVGDADERGHLPPDLVAAWPRRAPALDGLERRLVREHLERCESCRADLAMLGHDPALVGAVAGHAAPLAVVEGRGVATAAVPRTPLRAVPPAAEPRFRAGFGRWLAGAMVAVAAVAVVVVMVRRPSTPELIAEPAPAANAVRPAPGPDRAPSPPAAFAPPLSVEPRRGDVRPIAFADAARGAPGGKSPAVPVARSGAALHFDVPASLLQAELPDSVTVRLIAPGNRVLREARVPSRVLWPHRMISAAPEPALPEGAYVLRFVIERPGGAETRDYRFTIRR